MKKFILSIAIICFVINAYSQTNTFPSTGNVGIGTTVPRAIFDNSNTSIHTLKMVLARLGEGDGSGEGTYLGIKSYDSQLGEGESWTSGIKSFAFEHKFYGQINSSINFYRGGGVLGGFITFSTNNNNERMRIDGIGNIGIGTNAPTQKLEIANGNISLTDGYSLGWRYSSNDANQYNYITNKYGTDGNSGILYRAGSWTSGQTNIDHNFQTCVSGTFVSKMVILGNGNVGIGTINPTSKLSVNGNITAKEVNVTLEGWSDFVFKPTYKLLTLGEVEQFIKANNHLPEIPSEKEVKENGIGLGEMNAKLLQKIEELTLYLIEQQKMIVELNKRNELQDNEIKLLKEKNH